MILLIGFAFIAGLVTVLSPCILPILPIILSSSIGDGNTSKSKPMGVVSGFILSFTFFTLFLSSLVRLSGIHAETLRIVSVMVVAGFGLSLLTPRFQSFLERIFARISSVVPLHQSRAGFGGGFVIGLSVGLLWTPCVGPILASVISLAITGTVSFDAFIITLAYSLGTALPMFLIIQGGQHALRRVPWLLSNLVYIQKGFGALMILTAMGIFFNADRTFQTFVITSFPRYGAGLTRLEDNEFVRARLKTSPDTIVTKKDEGKPLFDMTVPKGPRAPELIAGGEWFNTRPLTLATLKGKVVLIDFWTYSCINCQRTLPYLRNWNEKYKDKGLVIIGVHAPEFEFEKNPKNVAQAIKDFGLSYPVMQDNNFATWRAYDNQYWPAKYLIDKDGLIRYTHFGEGEYNETEKMIQELLSEQNGKPINTSINNPTYQIYARTPETYLGYKRIQNLASPEPLKPDSLGSYSAPTVLEENQFAFSGNWVVMPEYANPQKNASLTLNFESKVVYLVMRSKGTPATMKVYVDNHAQFFGEDAKNGVVTIDADRLYKLVHLPTSGRHTLRLEFGDDRADLFAFTFG